MDINEIKKQAKEYSKQFNHPFYGIAEDSWEAGATAMLPEIERLEALVRQLQHQINRHDNHPGGYQP